jgi:hypothetical protein
VKGSPASAIANIPIDTGMIDTPRINTCRQAWVRLGYPKPALARSHISRDDSRLVLWLFPHSMIRLLYFYVSKIMGSL